MRKNSELLVRIDERVKVLPTMKQDISEIKDRLGKHSTRIAVIEAEHKKPLHNGFGGLIAKYIFGR